MTNTTREIASYRSTLKSYLEAIVEKCGISRDDVELENFQAYENWYRTTLEIDFEVVRQKPKVTGGHQHPTGSHACSSKQEVDNRIHEEFRQKLQDPAFTETLYARLQKDPKRELRKSWESASFAHSDHYHWHTDCPACEGAKLRYCPESRCINGRVPCPVLDCAYGHRPCPRCNGANVVTEQAPDGSMRTGPCPNIRCYGGKVPCNVCGTDNRVNCRTCQGAGIVTCDGCKVNGAPTGKVTYHYQFYLRMKPRTYCDLLQVPDNAASRHLQNNVTRILNECQETTNSQIIRKDDGGIKLTLDANVISSASEVRVLDQESRVTSIGRYIAPKFDRAIVDNLLQGQRDRILEAHGADAYKIAEDNPVFAKAAESARSGKKLDTRDLIGAFQSNALTEGFLQPVLAHLNKALDDLMARPYRRTWVVAAPIITLSGVLPWFFDPLLGLDRSIPKASQVPEWRMVADALLPVTMAIATYLLARQLGHDRAVRILGRSGLRKPGLLNSGSLIGAAAILLALTITWTGTSGPGQGPRPLAEQPAKVISAGLANMGTSFRHAKQHLAKTTGPQTGMMPSGSATTTEATSQDEATLQRGSSEYVKTLQRYLADLGYYGGNIDGIRGPKTRRAIEDMRDDARFRDFEAVQRFSDAPLDLARAIANGRVER